MPKPKRAKNMDVIEKPKNFKESMKKVLGLLNKYKFSVIIVIICAMLSAIFAIIGPKILGQATTLIFEGVINKYSGIGGIDFTSINRTLLILLGLYIVSLIFSFLETFIMNGISMKIAYKLRKDISIKLNNLPTKYFDKYTTGEILSRITNDVDTLTTNLASSVTGLITATTTMIGALVMMLSISPLMTILGIIILPLAIIWMKLVVGKSQKYFDMQQEYLGHINSQVEETYGAHEVVKAFNGESEAINKFNSVNEVLYTSGWKGQFLSGTMMPVMSFIGNLGYVLVSIVGGILTIKDKIKVGDILSFTQYIRRFTQPISEIAQQISILQSMTAASERVFEFLEEKEETEVINPVATNIVQGNIEFKHVKFGYNEDKIVIKDFSTKVKKGQKIAIVGPTGAGKTTIVKLLMRFYDVNSGEILIDGKNINSFNRQELRKKFGMVLQDTWLFSGTILDNIKYGKLDASLEEVEEASKAAKVDHFINTFPDGYNTELNEETSNVSGGQKQLLTIARVILADPKILILDEATSSVDTRTEILIQEAMDELMKNRTSFIIAHRLSTIRNADLILVINDGDIVEVGNHKDLIKKDGYYANLYNSQFDKV